MFLRTSISSTKKFFQKKLESFKSFISGGYERLPKSPPRNPYPRDGSGTGINLGQSYREFDKNQWANENGKVKGISVTKLMSPTVSRSHDNEVRDNLMRNAKVSPTTNHHHVERKENRKEKRIVYEGKMHQNHSNSDKVVIQRRNYLVGQKLKELEMMDKSNVEHVLDIEEVLHYYSRLTCPAYRDIVDKFFMEMYSELFRVQPCIIFT